MLYIYIMLISPDVNQCYIYILSIHVFIAIKAFSLLELNCITVTYCPRRLFILVKWELRLQRSSVVGAAVFWRRQEKMDGPVEAQQRNQTQENQTVRLASPLKNRLGAWFALGRRTGCHPTFSPPLGGANCTQGVGTTSPADTPHAQLCPQFWSLRQRLVVPDPSSRLASTALLRATLHKCPTLHLCPAPRDSVPAGVAPRKQHDLSLTPQNPREPPAPSQSSDAPWQLPVDAQGETQPVQKNLCISILEGAPAPSSLPAQPGDQSKSC